MKAELSVRWSKRERALLYAVCKATGGMLSHFLEGVTLIDAYGLRDGLAAKLHHKDASDERTLAQELDARGYDLTTLRFSIRKKIAP